LDRTADCNAVDASPIVLLAEYREYQWNGSKVAGSMAAVIRMQLVIPNNTVVSPQVFNRLFTMHGTAMVFLVGMPIIAGLMNYLVPLMIGARDMAFPRLNAFGYWMFLFGGLLLYFSYLGAPGLAGVLMLSGFALSAVGIGPEVTCGLVCHPVPASSSSLSPWDRPTFP